MKKNILFVASEYGSFNVIYPILQECLKIYNVGYIGLKSILDEGLIFKDIIINSILIDSIPLYKFDIFITGSSEFSDIDYNIWKYAAEYQKKSICVLDQAKDIEGRFIKNGIMLLPDMICVMNKYAQDYLVRFGIKCNRIMISGSPYLNKIIKYKIDKLEKKRTRENLKLNNKKIITFCTEYIVKNKDSEKYGYDEYIILSDIIDCLSNLDFIFKVYIRLHPSDTEILYNKFLNKKYKNIEFDIVTNDPDYKILQMSDLVIGMTSIILVEGFLLDIPIISYQPVKENIKIFTYNDIIEENLVITKEYLYKRLVQVMNDTYNQSINNARLDSFNGIKTIMKLVESF